MVCEICGNEVFAATRSCPFCGAACEKESQGALRPARSFLHKTVNLKSGRPLVEPALGHLQAAIDEARAREVQVLTIIHGYGSSGEGGAIRRECRKVLDYMASRGEVRTVIAGEDFHRRHGPARDLLRKFPELGGNGNLNRRNRGVTLVVL